MADLWKIWSEKEKQAFYQAMEIDPDYKALQLYFLQLRKNQGRETAEKVKLLYYRGLITIKKLCESAGMPLNSSLPNPEFFKLSNFDLTSLGSSSHLKKEVRALSKNMTLFSNCMKALSFTVKSKYNHPQKSLLGIPPLLRQSDEDRICQFCGKNKNRGSFVLKGVPDTLNVQLLPFSPNYHKALVRHGFNPRLELYMRSNMLLIEVLDHLKVKWNPAFIESSTNDYMIGLLASWEGKLIEFNRSQEKITIGDIYLSLESPVPWQLYYYWKQIGGVFPEPQPINNEQSVLTSSLYSNSIFPTEEKSNSAASLDKKDKSFLLRSPNKQLFTKTNKEVFSKSTDEKSKLSAYESALIEFKTEGEESMFSTWFSFNKNPNY
ncbi:unnamed protein product [Blepharisma stoltei]|uniref:Uncharacterized protein n=1 Tax=Blepharisma stoltei TaxID=1481888 RepID=A0AAU9IV22_9CILI|nr:unnamed protein product [Blepharisma stoltei]